MRCYLPIHSIVEFWQLGSYLNYPLHLSTPGRETEYPETSSDAIGILARWFEHGPIPVTVADREEDDPFEDDL